MGNDTSSSYSGSGSGSGSSHSSFHASGSDFERSRLNRTVKSLHDNLNQAMSPTERVRTLRNIRSDLQGFMFGRFQEPTQKILQTVDQIIDDCENQASVIVRVKGILESNDDNDDEDDPLESMRRKRDRLLELIGGPCDRTIRSITDDISDKIRSAQRERDEKDRPIQRVFVIRRELGDTGVRRHVIAHSALLFETWDGYYILEWTADGEDTALNPLGSEGEARLLKVEVAWGDKHEAKRYEEIHAAGHAWTKQLYGKALGDPSWTILRARRRMQSTMKYYHIAISNCHIAQRKLREEMGIFEEWNPPNPILEAQIAAEFCEPWLRD